MDLRGKSILKITPGHPLVKRKPLIQTVMLRPSGTSPPLYRYHYWADGRLGSTNLFSLGYLVRL